ncbi:MAG: mannose-6-phosphate isomerase, class I [Desulfobacteraceae bacterium]|nr:MAG: mannose-6-phosphate isomerase, class I [Desulfobacteraceae bacterium]
MKDIRILKNTIQEYEWGSHTEIAELLGEKSPSLRPQAELWMGAHPKAPSKVEIGKRWVSLAEVIDRDPCEVLGKETAEKFCGRLPFLFKVLAAAKPLSIQAHPDMEQAKEGFERENLLGIPPDSPVRNYRDDMHKPEILCALKTFWALNGFRKIDRIVRNMKLFCPDAMKTETDDLEKRQNPRGLQFFFEAMMKMEPARKKKVIDEVVRTAGQGDGEDPERKWILSIYREYPSDIGVLSPLYLNLIRLAPGQAMFLPARRLHAYLEGLGIELMANSDNVLRGGLTAKHVDVPELLKTLAFEGDDAPILFPREKQEGEVVYPCPAEEFVLSVIRLKEGVAHTAKGKRGVEMAICTQGSAAVVDIGTGKTLRLERGASAIIPASVESYTVWGNAILYKAAVPV